MKKIPLTLLIALGSTLFTNGATAQNEPLACQVEAAAGLSWEKGRWATRSFELNKFILVKTRHTLTLDSVGKVLKTPPNLVSCRNDYQLRIDCSDLTGTNLFFDPKTLKGGISHLLGGTISAEIRDTVTVQVFSCTPF